MMVKRWWLRWRGERVLFVTFWPQDYRINTVILVEGQKYIVRAYVRLSHQFEVWGHQLNEQ